MNPSSEWKCETCQFFVSGNCRRHAPVVFDRSWDQADSYGGKNRIVESHTEWPVVSPSEFCGDWKPR